MDYKLKINPQEPSYNLMFLRVATFGPPTSSVMTSIIEVEVKIEDKEPIKIKVSGNAVIVFQIEITM